MKNQVFHKELFSYIFHLFFKISLRDDLRVKLYMSINITVLNWASLS
jgi:hypothetical protein